MPPISTPRPNGIAKPDQRPQQERPVDEADHRVGQQVGREAFAGAALGVVEQPAHVRVREAAQRAAQAAAVVDVGAVRVAEAIGVGVVLAVVGDPGDHGALDGHRAEHRRAAPRITGEVLKLRCVSSR